MQTSNDGSKHTLNNENQEFPLPPGSKQEEKQQSEILEDQIVEHFRQSMIQLNDPKVRAEIDKLNF